MSTKPGGYTDGLDELPDMRDEAERLKEINADLLAALKWALPRIDTTHLTPAQLQHYRDGFNAIAKAEEGQG